MMLMKMENGSCCRSSSKLFYVCLNIFFFFTLVQIRSQPHHFYTLKCVYRSAELLLRYWDLTGGPLSTLLFFTYMQ